jgi:proton-translocating NADH-quinone oxidoreductase chain M
LLRATNLPRVEFGIDGISIFFILLTTFIIPLCILTSYKQDFIYKQDYCLYLLAVELFLILAFSATDLLCFFIFFESVLIPIFLIIGIWGSRERRVRATFFFILYTLLGSIFLLFCMLLIWSDTGGTSFNLISKTTFESKKQSILWVFVYFAFSVKIPTVPLHIWLPEAHVEAPTAGSVILAGLLLKLGGYGLIRVLLVSLSQSTIFFLPITDSFSCISIVYASFTTIRQLDMKRVVAYSSVAHMNLVVLGLFSGNLQGVMGSIFLMIAHGLVSSALFFLIGVLYDKYGTRIIYYYSGLIQTLPSFSLLLMLFSFANIGLPGTCNFIGELTVFIGLVDRNALVLTIAITGVIWSVLYSIFFLNRVVFGNVNTTFILSFKDISIRELALLTPLAILTIVLGIFPDLVFDTILTSVAINIERFQF